MAREIRIYCEGGKSLKQSFDSFFTTLKSRAREQGGRVDVITAGSGDQTCRALEIAARTHPEACNIMLRDSEGPLTANSARQLCDKYNWPPNRTESIFWMTELMEAWFHADKDALVQFYGNGFNSHALKANPRIEQIPKRDIEAGLREATQRTKKGCYFENKASHSAKLLERIDPSRVREAAPNCERLFQQVILRLAEKA